MSGGVRGGGVLRESGTEPLTPMLTLYLHPTFFPPRLVVSGELHVWMRAGGQWIGSQRPFFFLKAGKNRHSVTRLPHRNLKKNIYNAHRR